MAYEITDIDKDTPDEYTVDLEISRDGFRSLPSDMVDGLSDMRPEDHWEIVREGKRNPVIKANGSRIYMEWEDREAEVNLNLAIPEMADDAVDWLVENSRSGRPNGSTQAEEEMDVSQSPAVPDPDNGGGSEAGVGEVFKPFSHDDADYVEPGDEGFSRQHNRCSDCAHYDGEGNCHVVPDIEPEGYCHNYYADVGLFADAGETVEDPEGVGRRPSINLALWGEEADRMVRGGAGTVSLIVQKIKGKFEDRFGEDNIQFAE